jgi:hypothetical protein
MNVIIEPLSEQAWARVEARLMDRLANDPMREPPSPRPLRLCGLASKLQATRRRVMSWIELRAEPAASIDAAPESRVR